MTSRLKDQVEKKGPFWVVKRDTHLQQFAIDTLRASWKSEKNEYFPGPQPVSIERKHFHHLKKRYVVCEKSDGVRHVMLVFTFEGTKLSVIINRAMEITMIPLSLPKNTYLGTVLDGELINDRLFLIYDAVKVNGEFIGDQNLIDRLLLAEPIITGALKLATNPVVLRMKNFVNLDDLENLQMNQIPMLDYKSDGLIFTPVNEPVRTGTHETLFKWKPQEQNTVDFLARVLPTKWVLYVQEKGQYYIECELQFHQAPQWLTDGAIVECQYMFADTPRWWKPIGLRTDKSHPNNRRTYYNTLTNIKENIQWREFLTCTSRGSSRLAQAGSQR